MLFPHSGRHGFDNITPDATVPTPDKAVRPPTTLTMYLLLEEVSDIAMYTMCIVALSSQVVCAMLKRESQLRNAPETQQRLDDLNPRYQARYADTDDGDEKQPETMEEAKEMIAALRAQLQQVAAVVSQPHSSALREATESLHGASCDKEVFESIKARVVREFGLGPEYVDVLNSAVARFPDDADIVASANCECDAGPTTPRPRDSLSP